MVASTGSAGSPGFRDSPSRPSTSTPEKYAEIAILGDRIKLPQTGIAAKCRQLISIRIRVCSFDTLGFRDGHAGIKAESPTHTFTKHDRVASLS
jgi:hypothetical protein